MIEQPAEPAKGGYRNYAPEIVGRIRLTRLEKSLGFSLDEIVELLSLKIDPSADCRDVRVRAQTKLSDVEEKIVQLLTM